MHSCLMPSCTRFAKDYLDYCRQFLQLSKTPMLDLKSWLRRNLTSTSETSFFVPPCCWIAWTREERLSKVWEAGGHLSFRADTRTIRCWGQVRGRRRSMRTLSQQSFSLFSFSCSTNNSLLSSSCSSAWRVCGVCKMYLEAKSRQEKIYDLFIYVCFSFFKNSFWLNVAYLQELSLCLCICVGIPKCCCASFTTVRILH